jgi:large subunit ribosomal protein L1
MMSDQETPVDQEVDLIDVENETATKEQMPAEVAAINTDNDTAKSANKSEKKTKAKKSKQTKKTNQTKAKSKKYLEIAKDLDKRKEHQVEEAVELVKKLSYSKFDGTITLDIKLAKAKKGEEAIRGTVKLPHPTGKTAKIEIASDELIEKIKKGYSDFDILLTSPEMMPKLAQVAKILGPKGKMPNPKDGTVVPNPEEAASEISLTARYRMDAGRNLHIAIGKVSSESNLLVENTRAVLKALAHLKKESATLSPTMGPGVKISL